MRHPTHQDKATVVRLGEKRPRRVANKQAEGRRAAEEAAWRAQRSTDQTGWSKWQANETVRHTA